MSALDDIRAERLKKIERLIAASMPPYPNDSRRDRTIAEVLTDFKKLSAGESETTIAGRIRAKREHGGSTFIDLFDGTGSMQALLKLDSLGQDLYQLFLDTAADGEGHGNDVGNPLDPVQSGFPVLYGSKNIQNN